MKLWYGINDLDDVILWSIIVICLTLALKEVYYAIRSPR